MRTYEPFFSIFSRQEAILQYFPSLARFWTSPPRELSLHCSVSKEKLTGAYTRAGACRPGSLGETWQGKTLHKWTGLSIQVRDHTSKRSRDLQGSKSHPGSKSPWKCRSIFADKKLFRSRSDTERDTRTRRMIWWMRENHRIIMQSPRFSTRIDLTRNVHCR